MGTFIIKPTLASNPNSWTQRVTGLTTEAAMLDAINNLSGNTFIDPPLGPGQLRFTNFGNCIYLDGSLVPISFNGLPAGFTPLSAALQGSCFSAVGTTAVFPQFDILTEGPDIFTGPGTINYSLAYNFTPPFEPTMLAIVNNGFGFRTTGAVDNCAIIGEDIGLAWLFPLQAAGIVGTYEIQGFLFDMETPTDPIEEDTQITVTSPDDPLALDFTKITSVTLDWTDSNGNPHSINIPPLLWILITFHIFIFRIPVLTGNPPIVIVNITSTQFSGSVELGKLITIFFINATGIYSIIPGKTNDTIYDNDNGGTIDVKIPNPVFKTGYIGG
jgi:hypothetical protein